MISCQAAKVGGWGKVNPGSLPLGLESFFFSEVNSGLEAFNFTDNLQRVFFYTKMFMSCILNFLLYDLTQLETSMANC